METNTEYTEGIDDIDEEPRVVHPFDPKRIDIITGSNTVSNVVEEITYNEIKLDPDFQRKKVWDNKRKSRLIESLLLGIPLPMFYMAMAKDGVLEVVDGTQRLSTLRDFISPQENSVFTVLDDLEFLTDLNGKTFAALPRNHQRTIFKTNIQITTIRPGTPEEVKFNIFKRINTGGMPLSSQEIRNALHQGAATIFLTKLTSLSDFKKVITVSPERMLDKEFALRIVSYLLMGFDKRQSIDKFLSDGMTVLNKIGGTPEKLSSSFEMPKYEKISFEKLETLVGIIMERAFKLFGDWAFRRSMPEEHKTPINKPLVDSWGYWLGKIGKNDFDKLITGKLQFYSIYSQFMKSDRFDQINKHWGAQKEVDFLFDKIKCFIYGEEING